MAGVMGGLEGAEDHVHSVHDSPSWPYGHIVGPCDKDGPLSGEWGFLCSVGAHILLSAKMESSSLGGRGSVPSFSHGRGQAFPSTPAFIEGTTPSPQRISPSSEGPGSANRCWSSRLSTWDTVEGRVGDGINDIP